MRIISGPNVSSTIRSAYKEILADGEIQPTRNGYAKALYDVTFEVRNPRSRHLNLAGRKSNIFQLIAETFWVLSGANAVEPYLGYFLPRAINYSDDGKVWHGAYGPRLYMYNQLQDAIQLFAADKLTRRSYVSIQMPELDSPQAFREMYGPNHVPKDVPCNQQINFYVIGGNQFVAKTIQRSGDIVFGTGSINPFEFSYLQELVFNEVRKLQPDLELGPYRWHVTNAHVYNDFENQLVDAIASEQPFIGEENKLPSLAPSVDQWQDFFGELVAYLSFVTDRTLTKDYQTEWAEDVQGVQAIFAEFDQPLAYNQTYEYAEVLLHYIYGKKLGQDFNEAYDLSSHVSAEYALAIHNSTFRKFKTK